MRETRLRPVFNRSSELPRERWGVLKTLGHKHKIAVCVSACSREVAGMPALLLQENPGQDVTVSPSAPECWWLPTPSPYDILGLIFGQSGGRK